jgi:hypothetical protein
MTSDSEQYMQVALEMLRESRLGEDEQRARAQAILDPDYWRRLNPQLSVEGATEPSSLEATPLSAGELEQARENVGSHGYFQTPPTLSVSVIDALREGIELLRQEGLPPTFAFVYDEAWLVSRTPSLTRLVTSVVDNRYKQTWRVWCHYVPPVPGAGGWSPHRDGGGTTTNRLTLWIPLSPATLDNGCMYVIPKDMIPPGTTLETENVHTLLRATKALPARPGEVLGWEFQVIHWGSFCSDRPGSPRISLSQEFIARDASPETYELPLIEVREGTLPSFRERLYFISRGVIEYARFEPALLPLGALMEHVVQETGPAAAD